ncbi:uncharacterized protein PpBr36_09201 [Pyricularia pennisetigena]|uniref:uncharacterized protein n=1 Tax=Pyricularia pennisetigena TaxID=1578925 RepID=UPI0011502802|nr:uncharacterized protein PpBr36_09201 [Pyricularia pennisetigena]TLS21759.1 hypothetical protein PpBr36_09201 [Pyricularia pennisetigena]
MRAAGIVFPGDKIPAVRTKDPEPMDETRTTPAMKSGTFRVKKPHSFGVVIYPRHRASDIVTLNHFARPKPLTGRVASCLIHRSLTEPLWITASAARKGSSSIHNCAKSVTSRRLLHAFRLALEMHGYDKHGRRIQESSDKPEQLYGTVILQALVVEAIRTDFNAIVKYYHLIIDRIIPALGCASGEKPQLRFNRLQT